MAGTVSQSESDVIYRRIQNAAKQLLDVYEEIQRLQSLSVTLNLGVQLDESSSGIVSKAEAIAMFTGPLQDFEDWFDNLQVNPDGLSQSTDRRAKLDPFLVTERV